MKTKEELYKKLREIAIEISDVQKEKVLLGQERKHEAVLNNLGDLYNRTLDTLISKIRKDDIDVVVEMCNKEKKAWNRNGEYYQNVDESISNIIEHLQELKEKIWNQK